ncbi:DMT family transporter [Georgenia sunbinii]|uniref:DMT family transporter n=1 Tax=Georgenia sunbinii TaxID=3117728 RepID=UPI002F267BCD
MALVTDAPARRGTLLAPTTPFRRVPRMRRRLGVVAIIVSATAMGFSGVFGRLATPPGAVLGEALTLGRMLVGAVGVLVLLAFSRRLSLLRQVRMSWSVVLGGVFLGLSLATYLSATVLTDLARAVALHYLGPVIATVLARALLKERLSRGETVSMVTSFLGMMLASGLVDGASPTGSEQQLLGDGLAAASGVLYGLALLCYRYRSDMPADVRSFWNFLFGTLAVGGMVVLTRPDVSGMTAAHWAWAAAFFLVCGLLALGLLVVAGKHLRAVELSALSYWEVVVAMLLGAAVYAEGVSLLATIGAVAIVIAAVVPLRTRHRVTREASPSR